mmetsp:Transcript_37800/g.97754  ORF Transcript_37800/g.97754 Transcript_37800/m.97754 type:complete len:207 (-) Transcript_37800:245-865(-)
MLHSHVWPDPAEGAPPLQHLAADQVRPHPLPRQVGPSRRRAPSLVPAPGLTVCTTSGARAGPASLRRKRPELGRHVDAAALHDLHDLPRLRAIIGQQQCVGRPLLACAACAPDAVDILLAGPGGVVVHHYRDALDVEATGSHIGGNHDVGLRGTERVQCMLPLVLLHVAMDPHDRELVRWARQALAKGFRGALGLGEDEDPLLGML